MNNYSSLLVCGYCCVCVCVYLYVWLGVGWGCLGCILGVLGVVVFI